MDPSVPETESDSNSHVSRVYQSQISFSARDAVKTRSWWLLVMGTFAFMTPFNIAMGHGVVHLLDLGYGKEFASFSVGLVVIFSIGGRLLGGWLGDRMEPRYIWSFALAMMFAGVFLLKNGSGTATIYAYAALLGAGMGASYVCMLTLIGNYFGVNSYAQIMGLLFPIASVLATISPILAGIAYDKIGSYDAAFYGAMLVALLGAFLMPIAGPPKQESNEYA
jgi:MFS family permease